MKRSASESKPFQSRFKGENFRPGKAKRVAERFQIGLPN